MLVGAVRIVGSHLGRIPNYSEVPDTISFGGGLRGRGALPADNTPVQRKNPLNPPPPKPPPFFFNLALGGFLSRISHFRPFGDVCASAPLGTLVPLPHWKCWGFLRRWEHWGFGPFWERRGLCSFGNARALDPLGTSWLATT